MSDSDNGFNPKLCNQTVKALSELYKMQAYYDSLDEDSLSDLALVIIGLEKIQQKACQSKAVTSIDK